MLLGREMDKCRFVAKNWWAELITQQIRSSVVLHTGPTCAQETFFFIGLTSTAACLTPAYPAYPAVSNSLCLCNKALLGPPNGRIPPMSFGELSK